MEMLVIAVIAIVAFALVLIPLFRRRTTSAVDEREFDTGPRPADRSAAADVAGAAGAGGAAGASEASREGADVREEGAAAEAAGDDDVEQDVLRYRAALRAGTVCPKCGQANPAASAYCYECGSRLPLADAREFE